MNLANLTTFRCNLVVDGTYTFVSVDAEAYNPETEEDVPKHYGVIREGMTPPDVIGTFHRLGADLTAACGRLRETEAWLEEARGDIRDFQESLRTVSAANESLRRHQIDQTDLVYKVRHLESEVERLKSLLEGCPVDEDFRRDRIQEMADLLSQKSPIEGVKYLRQHGAGIVKRSGGGEKWGLREALRLARFLRAEAVDPFLNDDEAQVAKAIVDEMRYFGVLVDWSKVREENNAAA